MSIAAQIRALLDADSEMLARHDLAGLANELYAVATTFDAGHYTIAHRANLLCGQLQKQLCEVSDRMMGVEPGGGRWISRFVNIVDRDCERVGVIKLDHPDIDRARRLSDNLTHASLRWELYKGPPATPRAWMFGRQEPPEWAAQYPPWTPDTAHDPVMIDPHAIDNRRAQILTTLTDTPDSNAALSYLRSAGASWPETVHNGVMLSGVVLTRRSDHLDQQIRVTATNDEVYGIEVRLSAHTTGVSGIHTRLDGVPPQQLREQVKQLTGIRFGPAITTTVGKAGAEAVPPHSAGLAASGQQTNPSGLPDALAAARAVLGNKSVFVLAAEPTADINSPAQQSLPIELE
ncbi:hypothetical protein ACL02S_23880 [Nocardia sp. 004]|uniref:hypothetical protein n=1 Tax=Nocardia sp. 004 TaxID=3385978 RepID=UPI0039A224B0